LKELRISNNVLEDYGGIRLADGMLQNNQIRVVHAAHNKMGSDCAEKFAEVMKQNENFKDLDLSNNLFIMDELQVLAQSFKES